MALSYVDLLFRGVDIRVLSCRRYPAGTREKFFRSNMLDQISALLDPQGFIPHGHCYLWMPEVLWLHVMSDAIIAVAYFSIPFALAYFVKRRPDLAFKSAFVMFGIFIMMCGLTHVMGIVTIWVPVYWAEGVIKAITAFASLATAAALWPLIPRALTIPSLSALMRSREIQTELRRDLTERQRAADNARCGSQSQPNISTAGLAFAPGQILFFSFFPLFSQFLARLSASSQRSRNSVMRSCGICGWNTFSTCQCVAIESVLCQKPTASPAR